uniref:Histidine kinase n=1 Tax=Roseihalotalea indica TaxID=2867963 RepID=A0AA49GUB9_9BACT|nr:histidine kinase [Tunicatimonas sp. TK19036]
MPPWSIRSFRTPMTQVLIWVLMGVLLLVFQPLYWQASMQVVFPMQFWVKQGILFLLLIGIFYLNARMWVPRLLFHNKISWFILMVMLTALALMMLVKVIEIGINLPELMHQAFHPESDEPPSPKRISLFDAFVLILALLVLGVSTSVATVQKWQKDVQLRQNLEQQKISSELSFLKAQINPHFFFNTLNNIYALTLSDVPTARQALHTLSRMMRYVLYETRKDVTLLSQEIAFIQDYINLMQLRLTDKVEVYFDHPEKVHDVFVAPMLFLPFVENAFKHGVSTQSDSHIRISIRQQERALYLEVQNTIFPGKSAVPEESSGIGLVNTRRRLDLLYPNRYSLFIDEHAPENTFMVQLSLELS